MFRSLFVYSLIALTLFWIASDVKVGASLYSFEDNYLSIEFPKKQFRSEDSPEPWCTIYWNAESTRDELEAINDAVVN